MKLKKLEITGFKSFLEKTRIEFPAGVSAIVGPNGCGKSNIVDALRWGMGEQSAKQLRGKAMEDIIFAGADGKAPINMAEVSITMENDGTAPEDLSEFTEIMVTRRVFRSGEREYLLNKRPCRLKDIQELFLESGVGKKPFAIIKQGNVGAIAEATPEERRIFIEEAAGVSRYKTRKEDALKKIRETEENLLRLKDIIGEVKKQMNSLSRQARAAENYRELHALVKRLEIRSSTYHVDRLQEKIEETTLAVRARKEREAQSGTRLQQLETEYETIKLHQLEKERHISDQKNRAHAIQRTIDKTETELKHFREDIKRFESEITALQSAEATLKEKNDQLRQEIDQEQGHHTQHSDALAIARQDADKEYRKTDALKQELDDLNLKIKTQNTHYMELVANEARYKHIFQTAETNRDTLNRRLKIIDEEMLTAERKVMDHERTVAEITAVFEDVKQKKQDMEATLSRLTRDLESAGADLQQQIRSVQETETEYRKKHSTYQAMKKMADNFEWYKDGVKAIMQHIAPSKETAPHPDTSAPGDVLGVIADIITPDPGYETAVESVLGESLQYILVENHHAGIHYIDHLQRHNSGRSGFIPITALKSNGSGNTGHYSLERLIDHVTVQEKFNHVSSSLMGNVLVARDLHQALAAWERWGQNGTGGFTVVTKNGDMISPSGILIGGSRDRLTGILEKKQELNTLERTIADLTQALETAYGRQKEQEIAIQELRENRKTCLKEKEAISENEIETEKDQYRAMETLKHARRHLEIITLEQERISGEADDMETEIHTHKETLETVSIQVKSAHEEMMRLNERIQSVKQDLENYQANMVDLKLAVTELKTQVANSSCTLKRLKDFLGDGEKRLTDISEEIEKKQEFQVTLNNGIQDHEETLASLHDAFHTLQDVLDRAENDFQTVNDQLTIHEKQIGECKKDHEACRKALYDLELKNSQLQLQQTHIRDQLVDRYHQSFLALKVLIHDDEALLTTAIEEIEAQLALCRKKIEKIGDVNMAAITEYDQLKVRFEFLTNQETDLEQAMDDLRTVIRKTNKITKERFSHTFNEINLKLETVFPRLFEGGAARLEMTDPDKPLETGVELMISPPGKKVTQLSLLSGGEKALSSIAFIFAIFLIKPASFCIMDEIDAPLDDANVIRFNNLLKIIGEQSQIIMITHNKGSMEFADTLFGVTMEKKGVSKIVSVNFETQ